MNSKISNYFIVGTFVSLYAVVSLISTIHVIDFFSLSNPHWLAVSLAIAFEIGAAASLASIITMNKMNKAIVWALFFTLTAMQAMGNTYYAYTNLKNFQGWVELFGLVDEDLITQKRIMSLISGAILPLVALGFIKALVDYIKPAETSVPLLENDVVPILENDVENYNPIIIPADVPLTEPIPDVYLPQAEQTILVDKLPIHEGNIPLTPQPEPITLEGPVAGINSYTTTSPLDEIKVFKK